MDYGRALNYWLESLSIVGGDTGLVGQVAQQISKSDIAMLSFVEMLKACESGMFGHA